MNKIDNHFILKSFIGKSKLRHFCIILALLMLVFVPVFLSSCSQKETNELIIYKSFSEFEYELEKTNEKVHVINFWATWCKPCVKELPYFEQLHHNYKDKNVEVSLVSIDMENQIESHLKPFLEKHNLKSRLLLLLDSKRNEWMVKVDEIWSGGIPVTVIYNNEERLFLDFAFSDYEELEQYLKQFTN